VASSLLRSAYPSGAHLIQDREWEIYVGLDDLRVIVMALFNWSTSGRPIDRYDLRKEVDAVITMTAQMYRDVGTAETLVIARSLLLLNRPEDASANVDSVLIERARSYESK
jgi:hypothetical protein